MVPQVFSDMLNGVLRFGKYRSFLIVALIVNVLLINHFFFGPSITDLNPFTEQPPVEVADPSPPIDPQRPPEAPPAKEEKPPVPTSTTVPTSTAAPKPTSKPYKAIELTEAAAVGPPTSPNLLDLHDYAFDGPYIGWPLARVCNETVTQPGLVFVCDNNSGGIGNIRNFILTCIRYAIDAGASGVIMPRIQRRSEQDLSNIFTTGFQPFDYFFNEEHFRWAMGKYCPRMVVYDEVKDIPHTEDVREYTEFYPKDLNIDTDGCDGRGVNRHLDQFRAKLDAWLSKKGNLPSEAAPITVRFKWATFFEWPIYRDGPEFATTFGDILRIRKDIEELATKVLVEMSKFVGVRPNPAVLEAPFLGVHLRTEADALAMWPNYEEQSDGYLAQAGARELKHAYLACGNITEAKRFEEKAWDKLKLNVTSKSQLLQAADLQTLTDLSWDQQALVDFLVLQKSTHFTGCSFSSFTMNIAFRRHLMTAGIHTRMWKSPADEFSTLVGRFESWYWDWMFMYECMWP